MLFLLLSCFTEDVKADLLNKAAEHVDLLASDCFSHTADSRAVHTFLGQGRGAVGFEVGEMALFFRRYHLFFVVFDRSLFSRCGHYQSHFFET